MRAGTGTLARFGVAPIAGLAALALAGPAQATDGPPLPAPRVAPVEAAATGAATPAAPAEEAGAAALAQEFPANTALAGSATTQQEDPVRPPARVISTAHAQKSPGRAASAAGWRQVPDRVWFAAQYHVLRGRYHALGVVRRRIANAPEQRSHISVSIRAQRDVNRVPNCPRKLSLNVLQVSGPECLGDPAALPLLTLFVLRTGACRNVAAQYHPAVPRYQSDPLGCRASRARGHVADRSAGNQPRVLRVAASPAHRHSSFRTSAVARAQPPSRVTNRPQSFLGGKASDLRAARGQPVSTGDGSGSPSASLILLAAFALILVSAATAVAPLLRSRLRSKGLSSRPSASKRRGGIRYRE